jgi:hypothetical protein
MNGMDRLYNSLRNGGQTITHYVAFALSISSQSRKAAIFQSSLYTNSYVETSHSLSNGILRTHATHFCLILHPSFACVPRYHTDSACPSLWRRTSDLSMRQSKAMTTGTRCHSIQSSTADLYYYSKVSSALSLSPVVQASLVPHWGVRQVI